MFHPLQPVARSLVSYPCTTAVQDEIEAATEFYAQMQASTLRGRMRRLGIGKRSEPSSTAA
jgi:hypothetical protein